LQAGEARGDEALAPLADGVAVAVQFGGELLVVGPVVGRGTKDDVAAKDQGLRCGASPDQGLELLAQFGGKDDPRSERTCHERPPCCSAERDAAAALILASLYPRVQAVAANF
jgi:hypothetical protein